MFDGQGMMACAYALSFAICHCCHGSPDAAFGRTGHSAEREIRLAAHLFESVEIPTPLLGGLKFPNSALEPVDWDARSGWAVNDHAAAFATFLSSCRPLRPSGSQRDVRAAGVPVKDVSSASSVTGG